jgi:hypothetical protein
MLNNLTGKIQRHTVSMTKDKLRSSRSCLKFNAVFNISELVGVSHSEDGRYGLTVYRIGKVVATA